MKWIPPDLVIKNMSSPLLDDTTIHILRQHYPDINPFINTPTPTINKVNSSSPTNKNFVKMQSDSGANTSATDNRPCFSWFLCVLLRSF